MIKQFEIGSKKLWKCTFPEKTNKKGEKITFPPIIVSRCRDNLDIWFCVEDILKTLEVSEDKIKKIQKRDDSFYWSVSSINFADATSEKDLREFMSSRLLDRIVRYSKIKHKSVYLDWLYSLNEEIEKFDLKNICQKTREIFFAIPQNPEERKQWGKVFQEQFEEFRDYLSYISYKLPEEDRMNNEDILLYLDIISYCYCIKTQNNEEKEIVKNVFSEITNKILKDIIEE